MVAHLADLRGVSTAALSAGYLELRWESNYSVAKKAVPMACYWVGSTVDPSVLQTVAHSVEKSAAWKVGLKADMLAECLVG